MRRKQHVAVTASGSLERFFELGDEPLTLGLLLYRHRQAGQEEFLLRYEVLERRNLALGEEQFTFGVRHKKANSYASPSFQRTAEATRNVVN